MCSSDLERIDNVYFLNHEGDKFAQIRYDKDDGTCYIEYDLNKEISSFFSLEKLKAKKLIGQWVENTLQMEVSNTRSAEDIRHLRVENTLVSDTFPNVCRLTPKKLKIPYI